MVQTPANVHVSQHPCVRAKLSQLRSKSTTARETKQLVHEISLMLGTEALAGLETTTIGTVSLAASHSPG
jgi:uracil phosphoribosyltransferase